MFIAALFTVAKTCKQPKCPLTDEWIKKMYTHTHTHTHTHTLEYYSALKRMKEWDNAICPNMNELRDDYTKWSRQKYHYVICLWNLQDNTNELIYKTEIDSKT